VVGFCSCRVVRHRPNRLTLAIPFDVVRVDDEDLPSWRLKLKRAAKHREEVVELIKPFGRAQTLIVRENYVRARGGEWEYRLFAPFRPDPNLMVVIGDYLFNLRSALDHLAVALVPNSRRSSASFPILDIDPEAEHSDDAEGDARRRRYWTTATAGMPTAAVKIIRARQPFNAEKPEMFKDIELVPRDHVLALLSAFQNADKHRHLLTVADGLLPTKLDVTLRDTGEGITYDRDQFARGHLAANGARIYHGKSKADVVAEGTAEVAVGIRKKGPFRRLPDFLDELTRVVTDLVDDLEGHARE
jgi:hypothetical protein